MEFHTLLPCHKKKLTGFIKLNVTFNILYLNKKTNTMKTRKLFLGITALVVASGLIITSCKKKEEKDSDTSAASDHNYAENVSNDITNIGDQAGDGSGNSLNTYKLEPASTFMLSCAQSVTRDTVNKIITVDFGANPTICLDGRTRSGKLQFAYTGGVHYRDSGIVITLTPINYTVDGNQITGTKTIRNLGRINGNFKWNVQANMQIVKANGDGTISWSCNKTKELLNTSAVYFGPNQAIDWKKAKIGITGNANGTTAKGDNFTATVTNQLVRDFACAPDPSKPHRHPFIQGSIDFTPGTKPTRHIDFGNGNCDFDATVTINGTSYNITLH